MNEGAVDYITKPFAASELILKIERALETKSPSESRIESRPTLDQLGCRVLFEGSASDPLTLREMHVFIALNDAFSSSVAKGEIIRRVWGETKVSIKAFDVHLAHLRTKLKMLGLEIVFLPGGSYVLRVMIDAIDVGTGS